HQSDKLAVFVDDMRRNGFAVLGPDINASEAEFTVEATAEGHAVRYALAGIRNVGEKAMDALVAEREASGPFANLEEVFRRAPAGTMNRRQLEGLAAAGAFDGLEANRAKVLASADMLRAAAEGAERSRTSRQAGLFGGEDHAVPGLRLAEVPPWSRSEQMAMERENFGFYFAAHPVEQFRTVASANGARTYASLMAQGVTGGRAQAVMAAMVESVSKGRTRKGGDFVRADFSDQTGQFSAACFEEGLVESFQRWATEGTWVLLTVELDSPGPEEPPRVTVRGARPLADVSGSATMVLKLDVLRVDAVAELATLLARDGDARGEVLVRLRTGMAEEPVLRLGRDFVLDGELAERLAAVDGLANVVLSARRGPGRLKLVA
ncbi:MAG TPA: DNA polymerase III subunit alpha, partial [Novosphingobium sp.]|nr:DNA polymerase III subunit alpha [Novosphingobium sp.]